MSTPKKPAERIRTALDKITQLTATVAERPWEEAHPTVQEAVAQFLERAVRVLETIEHSMKKSTPAETREASPGPGAPWFDDVIDEMRD